MKKFMLILLAVSSLTLVTACNTTTTKSTDLSASANELDEANRAQENTTTNITAAGYNVQLGLGYLQQGDMQRAKSKLLLALSQAPQWPQALDAMGYYLENTGDTKTAAYYYQKAVSIAPTSGAVQNNYGTYLCRIGQYQEADNHFMLAIQDINYLNTAEAYENAGLCSMEIPDNDKALSYFIKAIQQDPHRTTSVLEIAQINYKRGDYSLAQSYLDNYFSQVPQPGPEAMLLAIRLAHTRNDTATIGKYAVMLQSEYPGSLEYKELRAMQGLNAPTTNSFSLGIKP